MLNLSERSEPCLVVRRWATQVESFADERLNMSLLPTIDIHSRQQCRCGEKVRMRGTHCGDEYWRHTLYSASHKPSLRDEHYVMEIQSLGWKPKAISRSASGTKFLWSKLVDDIDLLWDRCVYVINELMNSKLAWTVTFTLPASWTYNWIFKIDSPQRSLNKWLTLIGNFRLSSAGCWSQPAF